jgi:hypothetical protein
MTWKLEAQFSLPRLPNEKAADHRSGSEASWHRIQADVRYPAQAALDRDLHLVVQRSLPPVARDHLREDDDQAGAGISAAPTPEHVDQRSDYLTVGRSDDRHLHVFATPRTPRPSRGLMGIAGGDVDDGHIAADRECVVDHPRRGQVAEVGRDDDAHATLRAAVDGGQRLAVVEFVRAERGAGGAGEGTRTLDIQLGSYAM